METTGVKITALGDIMLGASPANIGFGVDSQIEKLGPLHPFREIAPLLTGGDILMGNLEAVLSDSGKSSWWLPTRYLRGAPALAKTLRHVGFNLLSVANNHMMQHGSEAFADTLKNLKEADIQPIGVAPKSGFSSVPFVTEIKGIKLGFLAYSLRPEEYRPNEVKYARGQQSKIIEEIRKLKQQTDFVILSLHWGDEFIQRPSPQQMEMGRSFIDNGAKIILGHHPHVLQGMETYKGGLIAYSLGNFVFDMTMEQSRKTLILEISLKKDGSMEHNIIPVMINRSFQPEPLFGQKELAFRDEFKELCQRLSQKNYNNGDYQKELNKLYAGYRTRVWNRYRALFFKYNVSDLCQLILLILIRRIFKIHI